MNGYWQFYEETARSVSFDDAGRVSHKLGGLKTLRTRSKEPGEQWIDAAEDAVWPLLYQWHYLRERRRIPEGRDGLTMREREDPEFVARLSEANRSAGVLDGGWRVVSSGPDECLCEKGGLQLRVSAETLQADGMCPGDETAVVRFPAERRYWMPHYYCIGGGMAAEMELRVYFNVKPASAPWLLRTLSRELHESATSYQFKLLNHPASYTRPDAAVLYVPASESRAIRAIVDRLMASHPSVFRGAIPALTRAIYPGVAVADEPPALRGRQPSFGEHRCRLLARGLARAHAGGCGSVPQTVDAICGEFSLWNIDPAQPYANGPHRVAAAAF
jgi:hypothetical protein